jgi:3-oxoacyl-[acyl-carrier protein] reductase
VFALFRHFDCVLVHYARARPRAEQVAQLVRRFGGRAVVGQADVKQLPQVVDLAEQAAELGPIRAVVHCAGVESGLPGIDLADLTATEIDETIDTDLKGSIYVAQQFGLRLCPPGALVLVSSLAGISPMQDNVHYVAAKAGLEGLVKALAARLGPGVRVNSVAPGVVCVDGDSGLGAETRDRLLDASSLGRFVEAREIAQTVKFLVTGSVPITGQSILVDAGLSVPGTALSVRATADGKVGT